MAHNLRCLYHRRNVLIYILIISIPSFYFVLYSGNDQFSLQKSPKSSKHYTPSSAQLTYEVLANELHNTNDSSKLILPDNISNLANKSEVFTTTFCNYRLSKANAKPRICLYNPEDDIFISQSIMKFGMWETELVATAMKHLMILSKNKTAKVLFIDLGANLGTFTLTALSFGFPTIAVDPMESTVVRLATSIYLNNFTSLATLYFKAISDRAMCGQMKVLQKNKGGSSVQWKQCGSTGAVVTTITLDQMAQTLMHAKESLNIVMKMDIQNFEPFAILGDQLFFRELKVRIIFLEWAEMKQALSPKGKQYKGEEYKNSIERAFHFLLSEMRYEVRSVKISGTLSWEERENWPGDVMLAQPGFWYGKASYIGQV